MVEQVISNALVSRLGKTTLIGTSMNCKNVRIIQRSNQRMAAKNKWSPTAAYLIDEEIGNGRLLLSENCAAMTIFFNSVMLYCMLAIGNIKAALLLTSKAFRGLLHRYGAVAMEPPHKRRRPRKAGFILKERASCCSYGEATLTCMPLLVEEPRGRKRGERTFVPEWRDSLIRGR